MLHMERLAPMPAVRRWGSGDRLLPRPWLVAWLGGPVIGIANGVIRELTYRDRLGELAAHQVSTATALALFVPYLAAVQRRSPLHSRGQAVAVGATWVALTVAFEFTFGHWVDGKSWTELLGDYDVLAGHLWPVILAWLGLGPLVLHEIDRRRR